MPVHIIHDNELPLTNDIITFPVSELIYLEITILYLVEHIREILSSYICSVKLRRCSSVPPDISLIF